MTRVTLLVRDESGRKQTQTSDMSPEDVAVVLALIEKYPHKKLECRAIIRMEFYNLDGKHDGGETSYIYEDHPLAEQLRNATTREEALKIIGPQSSPHYNRIEVTTIETHRGILT